MASCRIKYIVRLFTYLVTQIIDLRGTTCKRLSIKYVTLEGEGVREGVTVCDRGRGSRACDITLIKNCIIHMEPEI